MSLQHKDEQKQAWLDLVKGPGWVEFSERCRVLQAQHLHNLLKVARAASLLDAPGMSYQAGCYEAIEKLLAIPEEEIDRLSEET